MSSSVISSSTKEVNYSDSKASTESFISKDNTGCTKTTTTKDADTTTQEKYTSSVSPDSISIEQNLASLSCRKKLFALTNNALNACDDFFGSCDRAKIAVDAVGNMAFEAEEAILHIVAASKKIKDLTKAISVDSEHMTGEKKEVAENVKKLAHDNIKKARNAFIKTMEDFRGAVGLVTSAEEFFTDSMFSEEVSDGIATIKYYSTKPPEIEIGEKRKIDSVSEEDEKENKKSKI